MGIGMLTVRVWLCVSIWQSNVVVEGQLVHQRRISYVCYDNDQKTH